MFATLLFFYFEVFGGVLRFLFGVAGAPLLSYIPMLTSIGVVLVTLYVNGAKTAYDSYLLGFALFFVAYGFYGLVMGRSLEGVLFALYCWTPFFLGLLLVRFNLVSRLLPHLLPLLLLSIVGVMLTSLRDVPWTADTMWNVGGVEVSATRVWNASFVPRLAGFARASTNAANNMVLFALWFLCTRRAILLKIAVWAGTLYAVFLTTSKTPLLVIALAPVVMAPYLFFRSLNSGKLAKSAPLFATVFGYFVLIVSLGAVLLPPLLTDISNLTHVDLPLSDTVKFMRSDSLVERVEDTWPSAFELLNVGDHDVQSIFGRGIGGIGNGQFMGEGALYNSGDNLHVFLWITFGIFSYLLYALILFRHRRADENPRLPTGIYLATVFCVLGLGTMTSVVEAALPALALGMIVSACVTPTKSQSRRRRGNQYQAAVSDFTSNRAAQLVV